MNKYILSAASNLTPGQLRPFLNSISENVPDARVILFVHKGDLSKKSAIRGIKPDVEFELMPDAQMRRLFWLPPKRARKKVVAPVIAEAHRLGLISPDTACGQAAMHIVVSRFFFMREYLNKVRKRHSGCVRVVLSDSRDVVFQKDPFGKTERGILFGLEDIKNGDRKLTNKWIKSLYGKSAAKKLANESVICAGVAIGSVDGLKNALDKILNEIKKLYKKCIFRVGPDQAVLNKKVYIDGYDPALLENGNSLIVTAGTFNSEDKRGSLKYTLDEERGIVNDKGEVIDIVHQYDRKRDFNKWVKYRYK